MGLALDFLTPWNIFYFLCVFLVFACIILFCYLVYYHVIRSTSWPQEAKIEWSYVVHFGHAFELAKKPIYQIIEEYSQRNRLNKDYEDIIGFLVGGQRFFFLTNPDSVEIILKSSFPSSSQPVSTFDLLIEQRSLLFFGLNPRFIRKYASLEAQEEQLLHPSHLVNRELLKKLNLTYLLTDNASVQYFTKEMIKKAKEIFSTQIFPVLSPLSSSSSSSSTVSDISSGMMEVKLYDFMCRLIFHTTISSLFNNSMNNTTQKSFAFYDLFHRFANVLSIVIGGNLHISYLNGPNKAYNDLLMIVSRDYNIHNCNEYIVKRWNYFHELSIKEIDFQKEIAKYQLALLWSSVSYTMPVMFWMMFYILHSSSQALKEGENKTLLDRLLEEIEREVPNFHLFRETNFDLPETVDDSEPENAMITLDQLNHLHLLDACITETLRLTSSSLYTRVIQHNKAKLTVNTKGKSFQFRAGDRINISPSIFHYNENYYTEPNQFNPFRWMLSKEEMDSLQSNEELLFEKQFFTSNGKKTIKTKDGREVDR
jgi:hypothetical protein